MLKNFLLCILFSGWTVIYGHKNFVPMNKTIELLGNKGKIFTNTFVNSPICCPNRATILTGRYPHSTAVVNNTLSGNCSSKKWQKQENQTLAAFLKKQKNYTNFYAGKYLNKYGSKDVGGVGHVPEGYDWWIGLKGNSRYYNYTLSVNGTGVFHDKEYLTDVLANYSLEFLHKRNASRPFLMIVAPPAAHAPFTPAERHRDVFKTHKAVRTPSFNYTPENKHWIVNLPPIHLPENVEILNEVQRHRLESLIAVDEMVKKIIDELQKSDILNETYVIFTSDNGFHIGQFAQPWDKRQPYETDIRVPFLIRGPKVPEKSAESYPISSVDLTPTILDLAGVKLDENQKFDGQSFKKRLFGKNIKETFKKKIFVEYFGEGSTGSVDKNCPWKYDKNVAECALDQWCKCQDSRNNTYICVIDISDSRKFKFCTFKDDLNSIEAYDLTKDPFELKNIYPNMKKKLVKLYQNVLEKFKNCSGGSCKI